MPPSARYAQRLPEAHRRGVAAHRLQPPEKLGYTVCSRISGAPLRSALICTTCKMKPRNMLVAFKGIGKWTADLNASVEAQLFS